MENKRDSSEELLVLLKNLVATVVSTSGCKKESTLFRDFTSLILPELWKTGIGM
ncbi:MAG: hypothetical protein KBD43_14650 [Saprospiraceae bacterium]|nr:hypothetical protein [Saprospiraceae bacterium]